MDTTPPTPAQLKQLGRRKLSIVDQTLDDIDLHIRCPLDNGRHHGQQQHSAGTLDRLPAELVAQILLALDLPSLTTFRRVNRRAMDLVDSVYEYQMIFRHCPGVLRAIISIGARHFDCATLFKTLSAGDCATCDRFGHCLYLITCKRVCYYCFTENVSYFPISAMVVAKRTSLTRRELESLPHVLSVPGLWTAPGKVATRRIVLFDRQALLKRASEASGQTFDETLGQLDYATKETRRFMAIISAPQFISSGHSADWGLYCTGCVDDAGGPATNSRNTYTRDDIADHIARHGVHHGRNLNAGSSHSH